MENKQIWEQIYAAQVEVGDKEPVDVSKISDSFWQHLMEAVPPPFQYPPLDSKEEGETSPGLIPKQGLS